MEYIQKTILATAAMYTDKMEDALEDVGPILDQAQTPEEHAMLNAMFGQLIHFNDEAIRAIYEAAKRLESGNV